MPRCAHGGSIQKVEEDVSEVKRWDGRVED